MVALNSPMARASSSGGAASTSATLAPAYRGMPTSMPRPKVNATGGLPIMMSEGSGLTTYSLQQMHMAMMSRWKWTVPLGWPVVPLVKAMTAGSSAAVSTGSNVAGFAAMSRSSSAPAPASPEPLNCTTRCTMPVLSRAPDSSSMRRSSHSANRTCALLMIGSSSSLRSNGMVATATPPAFTTPNQQATSIGLLGARSRTRLPGARPRSSTSTLAMRLDFSYRSW